MNAELGLVNVWVQGDWITRGVALVLLGMSLSSWVVMLNKCLDLRNYGAQAKAVDQFWFSPDFASGVEKLGTTPANPFHALALQAFEASRHQQAAQPMIHHALDMSDWLTRALRNSMDSSTARLQSGLAVLASVGSTAPFVGLFGTVWGIYHALLSIGAAGQASIDKVAGPVGEALIMTALGLAVAIPAVLGYNALVRGNKSVLNKLNRFAHDLHAYFLTGTRVRSGNPANDGIAFHLQQA